MKFELKADVVRVCEPKTFASGSQMCEVHLTWAEETKDGDIYEQVIAVSFWGKSMETAMTLNQGDNITVQCAVGGREYDKNDGSGKGVFTSVKGWKIELNEPTDKPQTLKEQIIEKAKTNNNEADDLPF